MTTGTEALVRRAYHFAEGDVLDAQGFIGLFAEDGVFTGIGGVTARESYRGKQLGDVVVWMGKFLPDVHLELHRVNVLGDVAAIEVSIRGTFLGPFETPAGVIQPTGPGSTSRPPTSGTCATARSRSSTAISVSPPSARSWAYCRTSPPQSRRPRPHDNADRHRCAAAQRFACGGRRALAAMANARAKPRGVCGAVTPSSA
jgi:SnoaL-like domain